MEGGVVVVQEQEDNATNASPCCAFGPGGVPGRVGSHHFLNQVLFCISGLNFVAYISVICLNLAFGLKICDNLHFHTKTKIKLLYTTLSLQTLFIFPFSANLFYFISFYCIGPHSETAGQCCQECENF